VGVGNPESADAKKNQLLLIFTDTGKVDAEKTKAIKLVY
jgi:hypothetical protein